MKKSGQKSSEVQCRQELEQIRLAVAGDPFWESCLAPLVEKASLSGSIHLGVFIEPWLSYVLDGSKTVESRFSSVRTAPFGKVCAGDVLLIKRSGGPVVAVSSITNVWSYHLDPSSWQLLREKFAEPLRAQDPEFWESKKEASYATLMFLDHVREIDPVGWEKKDRRGWVVVQSPEEPTLFGGNDAVSRTKPLDRRDEQ